MNNRAKLSYCADDVRQTDNDRFLCALFAPGERREAIFALYAFNGEVARIRATVSEPLLGQIRLQWWRDALDAAYGGGTVPGHPVAQPLAKAIHTYDLPHALFDQLLDARLFDLEQDPPDSVAALLNYVDATSGNLVDLALRVLLHGKLDVNGKIEIKAAINAVGRHWGLIGLMRAVPYHAGFGKSFIPLELHRRHRLKNSSEPSQALAAAVSSLVGEAQRQFASYDGVGRAVPKSGLSALLPAVLSQRYARVFSRAGFNPYDARVQRRGGAGHHLNLLYANLTRRI